MDFAAKFEEGLSYDQFLQKYADDEQKRRWDGLYNEVSLTDSQKELLKSFVREMKLLVTAGSWCGVRSSTSFGRREPTSDPNRTSGSRATTSSWW